MNHLPKIASAFLPFFLALLRATATFQKKTCCGSSSEVPHFYSDGKTNVLAMFFLLNVANVHTSNVILILLWFVASECDQILNITLVL